MKALDFEEAMGQLDDKIILELVSAMNNKKDYEGTDFKKRRPHGRAYRRIITIAAAIAVFFALGIAAYATNLFGLRALFVQDSEQRAYTYERQADGTVSQVENPDGGFMSLTQPQAVPEGLDPNIAEKVAKSKAAWAEWSAYVEKNMPRIPDVFSCEGAAAGDMAENGDGTYTVTFYTLPDDPELLVDPKAWPVLETRIATAEEYADYQAYLDLSGRMGIDGYDFNYKVYSQEAAAKIEEIAEKYALNLRRESHLAWSSETTGHTGADFYTNSELASKTAEFGNAGSIFAQTPVGFDKVYWFDEGTFCVSYYVDLPSTGERVSCYGYNSVYSTLSSGEEVFNMESDLEAFSARIYTAQDGTDVTILFNGADSAYIYVYLENSFFAEHIFGVEGMTDTDLDYIADQINYSLISK